MTTPTTQPEDDLVVRRVYAVDDRGLFCRHCGKATWLHYLVRGLGFLCDKPSAPARTALKEQP